MTTAQTNTVPYSVPAVREETMSPDPTPVAATTSPGPINLRRLPQVEGASCLAPDLKGGSEQQPFRNPLSDPAHQQGVSEEEQDDLRDGDRGEGGQVRQPGAYGEHHPDAGRGPQGVDERGEVGTERGA
jgi:hypothetical protein